ncbi:hypothetical protein F4861DRAFT_542059 [Xylaria intraflava]|nr:hypothetical protein F4861DRAFT_542059 [Xylaria intraflava]
MFIAESLQHFSSREAHTPPRTAQPKCFETPPSPPWDGISLPLNPATPSSDVYSSPPVSEAGSPAPRNSSSRKGSFKRRLEGSDVNPFTLPSCQDLLPCHQYRGNTYAAGSVYTPSITPELSEDGSHASRPNLFPGTDFITEQLNCLRMVENKCPLPPLESLFEPPREQQYVVNDMAYQQYPGHTHHAQPALQDLQPYQQQPPPAQEPKPRRKRAPPKAHCNIKYLVEELDYIRYQRVDLAQAWPQVEAKFTERFPMVVFPKQREKEGLQGVNYRQNHCLPHLRNGQLVFMKNGHVDYVCTKTRQQSDRGHLYTLVYLFPDRAMKYSWVSPVDRRRAAKLNEDRQRQLEEGRRTAKRRGTYVEKLPANRKCGCCPAKDRQRNMTKRSPDSPNGEPPLAML